MTRYIALITSFLLTVLTKAQQNCPTGYEERTVKCNGQYVTKCVPINYSCTLCWAVSYPPCPGKKDGGTDFFNSYESALKSAQKEGNGNNWKNGQCSWYDNRSYKIYLDESKYCNLIPEGNNAAIGDLKKKIIPFLKRYKDEISNYKRYFSGQPYKPGAIYNEYDRLLKQAEKNADDLSFRINGLIDDNLSELESAFENVKNDETRLIQIDSNYKNSINSAGTSKINTSSGNNSYTTSNTNTIPSNTSNTKQDQYNSIMEDYNRKIERNQKTYDNLSTRLQNIYNIYQESEAKKRANEQALQDQKRKQEQERRQLEEQERLRKEEERQREFERQLQKAEEQRQEMERQFQTDQNILGEYMIQKKASEVADSIKQVYYIVYERNYLTNNVKIKTYSLYKYSDDSWMMQSDLLKKISFVNYRNISGMGQLLGAFPSKSKAKEALDQIRKKANVVNSDYNFLELNTNNKEANEKKFWDN